MNKMQPRERRLVAVTVKYYREREGLEKVLGFSAPEPQ